MKVSGFKKVGIIAAMAVIGFAFTACGNGANGPEEELPGNGPGGWQGRSVRMELEYSHITLGRLPDTYIGGPGDVNTFEITVNIFNLQEFSHRTFSSSVIADLPWHDDGNGNGNGNEYTPPHRPELRDLHVEIRGLPAGTPTAVNNTHIPVTVSGSVDWLGDVPSYVARGEITFSLNQSNLTETLAGTASRTITVALLQGTSRSPIATATFTMRLYNAP